MAERNSKCAEQIVEWGANKKFVQPTWEKELFDWYWRYWKKQKLGNSFFGPLHKSNAAHSHTNPEVPILERKYINNIFYDNYESQLNADRNWNWEERGPLCEPRTFVK